MTRWRTFRRSVSGQVGLALVLILLLVAGLGPAVVGSPYDIPGDSGQFARLSIQGGKVYWLRTGVPGLDVTAPLLLRAGLGPAFAGDPCVIQEGTGHLAPLSVHGGKIYWSGTDVLGRDMTARLFYGARYSLLIALTAVTLAMLVGVPLGVASGYFGGRLDFLLMRVTEVALSLPAILLAIVIVTIVGVGKLSSVVIAVALVSVPPYIRQVRATAMSTRQRDYVIAARALGAGHGRILLTAILPSCVGPITVLATLGVGTAILDAAGLNFLGLGPEPETPEWGLMLNDARNDIIWGTRFWWTTVLPGVAILLTVLGFNLLGDALRDALDERPDA